MCIVIKQKVIGCVKITGSDAGQYEIFRFHKKFTDVKAKLGTDIKVKIFQFENINFDFRKRLALLFILILNAISLRSI